MFVWTGYGWIGAVLVVGGVLGVTELFGKDRIFEPLPLLLVITVTALPCFFVGRLLNRNLPRAIFDPPISVMDSVTGAPRYQNPSGHTLAFIRLEFAGVLTILVLFLFYLDQIGFFG